NVSDGDTQIAARKSEPHHPARLTESPPSESLLDGRPISGHLGARNARRECEPRNGGERQHPTRVLSKFEHCGLLFLGSPRNRSTRRLPSKSFERDPPTRIEGYSFALEQIPLR